MNRRNLNARLAAFLAGGALPAFAQQKYPERPIRIVVPFLPGGSPDVVARVYGEHLSRALGQPVLIDNKPGANGIIGAEAVIKAPADGYTLLVADTGQLSINPSLYKKLPYAPLKDFAPISIMMATPLFFVVRSEVPATTLKELVELSQAQRGLRYGSGGNGSALHLGVEIFKKMSGAMLEHVPYKGVAQVAPALLAGDVSLMYAGWNIVGPHVKSGKMRVLAVGNAQRTPSQPDVPTVAESGFPGFSVDSRNGLLAPAGTSDERIRILNREVGKIARIPEVRDRLAALGIDVMHSTPEQYSDVIKSDLQRYAQVVAATGVSLD